MDKEKDKKHPKPSVAPPNPQAAGTEIDEFFRGLQAGRAKPGNPIATALEAAQGMAAETGVERAAADVAQELTADEGVCGTCGHSNRPGNRFCAMCGAAIGQAGQSLSAGEDRLPRSLVSRHPFDSEPEVHPSRPGQESHHYHHHYHHHYFPGGSEGGAPRAAADPVREPERARPAATFQRGEMSRAEAAVRRIAHEWVLSCNTKHLDDLLELYVPDALVLRSNYPPIRGAAAVREFFFGALDAGLGEVEIEPLRVDVSGDMAYETGRCKALVPSSTGKRREERGKYLWVCQRQANGEWKLAADCWASDLTLTTLESDVPPGSAPKTTQPRKNP